MTGSAADRGAASGPLKILPVDSAAGRQSVARLAREIWFEHYVPIIGRAQVEYMLAKFQSPAAIEEQGRQGLEYFLMTLGREACGYFAIEPQPAAGRMFLSKFYLLREVRGRGLARAGIAWIETRCREAGLPVLWLTVNKFNPALAIYERLGFIRVADVVADIGGGFVMDDYRMEKRIMKVDAPA